MAAEGCTPQLMSAADLGGIDQNKWPSHDGAERSVQLRTAGTALPSTTPGWITNRWKPLQEQELEWRLIPRPTARIDGLSAHLPTPAPGRGGGVVRIDRAFGAIHGPLSIVNRESLEGWIREGPHSRPGTWSCNELTTVVLLVALSPCHGGV